MVTRMRLCDTLFVHYLFRLAVRQLSSW